MQLLNFNLSPRAFLNCARDCFLWESGFPRSTLKAVAAERKMRDATAQSENQNSYTPLENCNYSRFVKWRSVHGKVYIYNLISFNLGKRLITQSAKL